MGDLTMDIYLKHLKARYVRADRKAKSRMLDEFCETSGLHRKHVIRVLTGKPIGWREKPPGRKKHYEPKELLNPLKEIWLATDQMCGDRLHAAMPIWLPFYEKNYGQLDAEIQNKLLTMSKSTINRLIKPLRAKFRKKISGTKPGSLLRNQIPIKTNQWNEREPGFVEADTVAHCGTSLMGNFIWSITLTDIYSGWTENAAVWNKGAHGVLTQIKLIEHRLPFQILGFDSDNGGEFLNYHLLEYFQKRKKPPQFTRSRPYHKGDNAHVEQKNWTHVRQLFGYYRLENPHLVNLMNDLYRNELALLHNYFYPAMKLQDKRRVQSKIIKKYDKAQTPYQRLMSSVDMSDLQKQHLKQIYDSLDPFLLNKKIKIKLKNIFSHIELSLNKKVG